MAKYQAKMLSGNADYQWSGDAALTSSEFEFRKLCLICEIVIFGMDLSIL